MTDAVGSLTSIQSAQLLMSLETIVDRARASLDLKAIAGLLAQGPTWATMPNQLALLDRALSLDAGFLEALVVAGRENDATFIGALGGFFTAVVALAAAAVGHTSNANDSTIHLERDRSTAAIRQAFFSDSSRAVLETLERMMTARGSVESRVRHVVRSIGLSPGQAASLSAAREALFAYLASPARAVPTRGGEARASRAGYTRVADPKAIVAKGATNLSAAQRAALIKVMTPNLDDKAAELFLNRHARALVDYRLRTIAGHEVHKLAEQAKLSAWVAAQRVGIVPSDQRRFWETAGDERVRHSHAAVPGMNTAGVPLNKPFATPLGDQMTPPLEINCRCKAVLRKPA